jgi:hypothetical protein
MGAEAAERQPAHRDIRDRSGNRRPHCDTERLLGPVEVAEPWPRLRRRRPLTEEHLSPPVTKLGGGN